MFRSFQKRMEIIRNAYARVYVASYTDRYWIPYRLQSVERSREKVADECLDFILDSGFNVPTTTNEDILENAEKIGPHWVIPKDYLPWDYYKRDNLDKEEKDTLNAVRSEYDGDYQEATTDSVLEFIDLWEESPTNARPIIPLQPDHVEHYRSLPDRLREFGYYCLGGIAKAGPEAQVRALKRFREEVGYGPQIHALGVGSHPEIINAIRDDPALVDSLDISTPEQAVKNGSIPDKTHKQPKTNSFKIARGENSSTTRASFMEAVYLHLCYCIGPFLDDEYYAEDENGRIQSGLQNW